MRIHWSLDVPEPKLEREYPGWHMIKTFYAGLEAAVREMREPTNVETTMKIVQTLQRELGKAKSLYRVAKDTGISYSVIHGLANSNRDVKLETVQILVDYFGLELVRKQTKSRKRSP